jgi:hypothetical protein
MRRLLRAPVVALVVLVTVSVGYALDRPPATAPTPIATASTTASTSIARSRTATVAVAPVATSTTSTTAPTVEGDDDPAAIDGRSWTWDELADCESGLWGASRVPIAGTARWTATRAIYQGGLQLAAGTWDTYKEPGDPDDAQDATREQQIVVGEKVIARQGPRAWPTCAPRLGMIGPDLPLDDPITPSVPLAETLP